MRTTFGQLLASFLIAYAAGALAQASAPADAMPMTAGEVVLAVIGACVLARMALSLYRIGRGVAAARSEVAVWRRQHPGRRHQ